MLHVVFLCVVDNDVERPFEVLKNQIQANTPIYTPNKELIQNPTVGQRVRYLLQTHGIKGLYRGILPGTIMQTSNGENTWIHADSSVYLSVCV